jgi:hypothetical protein
VRRKALILGIVNLAFAAVLAVMSLKVLYLGRDAVKQEWMVEPAEFYESMGALGTKYQRLVTSLEMLNASALVMIYAALGLSVASGIFLLRAGGRMKIFRDSGR